MRLTAEEIVKKYTDASGIKSSWDSIYQDVFDYCMPARAGYQKTAGSGQKAVDQGFTDTRENQYSSLAEQCADEFVNTMQDLLCPPQANWIDMEAGTNFKEEDRPNVNKELEKLCTIANEHKNNSTFDISFSEFCYDLFAGTACMLVLPDRPRIPVSFKAVPLKEYCIEEGKNGEVRGVFRNFQMKRELLKYQWVELKSKTKQSKEESAKDIDLIECTWYDYDVDKFYYDVVDKAQNKTLVSRTYDTNPFIVLRWNKAAGEPYGRGPGIKILNDVKTLNLVKEYSLRNFAFNLPPLLCKSDAEVDVEAFDFTPLAINIVSDTENIKPLELRPNYDIEAYKVQELSMDIKKNSYASTLPNEGDKNLTATEVLKRTAEMRKNLNSVFGRIIGEFQIPIVRRVFDILKATKLVGEKFEIGKIDGLVYKVKINTPLSKQLNLSEAQAIMGAVQLLVQLDPTGTTMRKLLDINPMGVYLMDILGVPSRFIFDLQKVKVNEQTIAEEQQTAQTAAIQQNVDAENAIAMGKEKAKAVHNQ